MANEHKHDEHESKSPRRHRRPRAERPGVGEQTEFITKDDLSQFLSIKPYLGNKAQLIVDLLAEVHRTGGQLDLSTMSRLLSLTGGDNTNLSAIASLANMAGPNSKLDPNTLLTLLGRLGQLGSGSDRT